MSLIFLNRVFQMEKVDYVTESVQWIDQAIEIDRAFLDEVPMIPEKAVQGIVAPMLGSAVEKLFEYTHPESWALFVPYKDYQVSVRRLFKRKILNHLDTDWAKDQLDNFLEEEENEHAGKLYEMFQELEHLDAILEEIHLNILSCLKS